MTTNTRNASVDRQIVSALDRLHREIYGNHEPCRFTYDGVADTYICDHQTFSGHDVIGSVEKMNHCPLLEGNEK